MWALVRRLQQSGVTIILTTHYIEEAQEMADRIGIIRQGELLLVEDKVELMRKLGKKQLSLSLPAPLATVPPALQALGWRLAEGGEALQFSYDAGDEGVDVPGLLQAVQGAGVRFSDIHSSQSSLEDIFVNLLEQRA